MADDVSQIYKAIDELNERVNRLVAQGTLEQRVKAIENYIAQLDKSGETMNQSFELLLNTLLSLT